MNVGPWSHKNKNEQIKLKWADEVINIWVG